MNGRDIESILAQNGGLRKTVKDLESSVKTCNKDAVLKMLDANIELEILSKTNTINYKDWEVVSNRLRDLGNKFSADCTCNDQKRNRELLSKREKQRLEYCNAIDKIATSLQREIKEKNTITMSTKDLAKKMGMSGRPDTSIFWGAKYCLFEKGIIVTSSKKTDLILRPRTPDDKLSPTLKRWFEEL